MNIALVIITVSLAFILYLGIRAKRGVKMDLEQWSVGGGGFSSLFVFVLMAGELYTTFTFLGASGFAYGFGGACLYIIIYTVLAFVMSYWLLPPIWRFAKQHNVITQSEFFEKAYDSKGLGIFVAVVALASLFPYLILQFKGLGIIVELTSYGALSSTAAIWIGAGVMTLYTINSGMHGSAYTAVLKDIVVLAVCAGLGFYLPYHYYDGLGGMFQAIENIKPGFAGLPETGKNTVWFISTVMISALGMYFWPHAFGAIFTSKAEKNFRKNAVFMPLYALVMLFAMLVGLAAIAQIPTLQGGKIDLALLQLSIKTFDPWLIGVIGVAGLLTAIVPGSMMLISAATLFTRNLYQSVRPTASAKEQTRVSGIAALVISLLAILMTLNGGQSIVALLIMGFSFVTQLVPAAFAFLSKRNVANKHGAIAGISIGVGTVAFMVLSGSTMTTLFPTAPSWVHDVNIGVIALSLNVATMIVVSALTKHRATYALNSEA